MSLSPNTAAGLASALGSKSGAKQIVDMLRWESPLAHNAKGDGTSDDTVALQAWVNENAGKTVYLPELTFLTGTVTLPAGTSVIGSGPNSKIKLVAGTQGGAFYATGVSNISIRGVHFEGTNTVLDTSVTERLLYFNACTNVSVRECEVEKTVVGVQFVGCTLVDLSNNYIHDIVARSDGSQGYGTLNSDNNSDGIISNNRFYTIGRHAIYVSSGSVRYVVANNIIDGSVSAAMNFFAQADQNPVRDCLVTGNIVRNVGSGVSPRGINIQRNSKNITITGNVVSDTDSYGISCEGSSTESVVPSNISITGNTIDGCGAQGVWLTNTRDIVVTGNTITNCTTGVFVDTSGTDVGSMSRRIRIADNTIRTMSSDGIGLAAGATYSTGTVAYDHTGGAYEKLITLTTGTWPAWTAGAYIMLGLGGPIWEIDERKSDTEATLKSTSNPGADVSSLASPNWKLVSDGGIRIGRNDVSDCTDNKFNMVMDQLAFDWEHGIKFTMGHSGIPNSTGVTTALTHHGGTKIVYHKRLRLVAMSFRLLGSISAGTATVRLTKDASGVSDFDITVQSGILYGYARASHTTNFFNPGSQIGIDYITDGSYNSTTTRPATATLHFIEEDY